MPLDERLLKATAYLNCLNLSMLDAEDRVKLESWAEALLLEVAGEKGITPQPGHSLSSLGVPPWDV